MKLAVNIDHIATLRQARAAREPEPILAALLAEQAGASGIVCHLRGDRRHIQERDLKLLRQVIVTKLNLEMAATEEMLKVAREVKPDTVSLVPESPEEITTQGGLEIINQKEHLTSYIQEMKSPGIKVSILLIPWKTRSKPVRQSELTWLKSIRVNMPTPGTKKSGRPTWKKSGKQLFLPPAWALKSMPAMGLTIIMSSQLWISERFPS